MCNTIKRFIMLIFIAFCMFWGNYCQAQSQFSPVLTKMENSLFGIDYGTQTDKARLQRIEETVYGSASNNSVSERVTKLSKDLSVDVIGQKIKPKKDTFAEDNDSIKENIPKADSSVNYPIVNELEKNVFNKEFKNIEINQRLANLEKNVFKKTYDDDLNSRVDRLKSAVMPKSFANNYSEDDASSYSSDEMPSKAQELLDNPQLANNNLNTPDYNSNNSVQDDFQGDSNIVIPLANLEKMVLKKSFPNDNTSNRLSRLELNVFHTAFADDDEQTRMDRIASAYQAKKTSKKYDNNKFAQHAATAMQIGAILLLVLAAVL